MKMPALLFSAFVLLPAIALSQGREPKFAYVFDGTEYVKVEVATRKTVGKGSLYEKEDIRPLLPESIKWGSVSSVPKYDPNTHRLFYVATQPETYSDERWKERIIIVSLPDFRLIGKIDLDRFVTKSVNILPSPDGKTLFVAYDLSDPDRKDFLFVRETYDTATLKLLGTKEETIARSNWTLEAGRDVYFSEKARFSDDGKTIYDELTIGSDYLSGLSGPMLAISDGKVSRVPVSLPMEVTDFVAGNPEFKILWCDVPHASAVLAKTEIMSHRQGPANSSVRLVQGLPVRVDADSKRLSAYGDGQFAVYDGMADSKLKRVRIEGLAGFDPAIVAVEPDRDVAYFTKTNKDGHRELFLVGLAETKQPVQVQLFGIRPKACIFSDL